MSPKTLSDGALLALLYRLANEAKRCASRLWEAARRPRIARLVDAIKSAATRLGLRYNPVGAENEKTGVPSTYRPVGSTCPADCRFLLDRSCYALSGNVREHQSRAADDPQASAVSFAIALYAAMLEGTFARLHVSGDFVGGGSSAGGSQIDARYVRLIIGVLRIANVIWPQHLGPRAFGYTHVAREDFEAYREALDALGCVILYSDALEAGGAVSVPFEAVPELRRAADIKIAKCPAQLAERVTCASCSICPRSRQLGVAVAFDPHGGRKRTAAASAKEWIRGWRERQSIDV